MHTAREDRRRTAEKKLSVCIRDHVEHNSTHRTRSYKSRLYCNDYERVILGPGKSQQHMHNPLYKQSFPHDRQK